MKPRTLQSLVTGTIALLASPALVQTNNQTMDQEACTLEWIVVGLVSGYLAS
jgi:hypothetical protein